MAYRKGDSIIGFTPSFPPFVYLYHFLLLLVRLVDWLVFRLTIKGRENMRKVERALLVSNHTLLMDPGIIAHAIRPRRTYFTMLEETALIPHLGTFVRLLGGVPIPEHHASVRTLETAVLQALQDLGFIHFFPEGECYRRNQDIRPFHPGAFFLACRLRVPVVPLTTVLYERQWFGKSSFSMLGRTLRLPLRVTIVIGEPLYAEDFLGACLHTSRSDSGNYQFAGLSRTTCPGIVETATSLKGAAKAMSRYVRELMQATVDREGGCKTICNGKMPRLVKQDPARRTRKAV
jgi:1-acyl-sn-glycerol-3-phosphate acyltransferase